MSRLPLSGLGAIFAALALVLGVVGSSVVPELLASAATEGYRSVVVSQENEQLSVVVMEGGGTDKVINTSRVVLPAGRPGIFRAYDSHGKLRSLAITTGDGQEVRISSRSTAAALIGLSPGIIGEEANWLSVIGHAALAPGFEELVAQIGRSDSIDSPAVRAALSQVISEVSPTVVTPCGAICAEWSGDGSTIVVENSLTSWVAVRAPGGETCGLVAPATLAPDTAAASIGSDALAGRSVVSSDLSALRRTSTFTRVIAGPCSQGAELVSGGGLSEASKFPRWATRVFEYLMPLYQMFRPDAEPDTVALLEVARRAAENPASTMSSIAEELLALDLGSTDQLKRGYLDLVGAHGEGSFATEGLTALAARLPAFNAANAVTLESLEVAAEPTPSESIEAATAPPIEPQPPATTVPVGPAPGTRRGALSATHGPLSGGPFSVSVTVSNSGAEPISLSGVIWRLEGPGGLVLSPTSVGSNVGGGVIDPGESAVGDLQFDLPAGDGTYRLTASVAGISELSYEIANTP